MSIRPIRVEVTNVFRSDRSWKRRCRDGLQAHHWRSAYLPKSRKSPTHPYDCPITPLSLLSSSMLLSAILVLLLIPISHSPTTSPTSPAPASCTYAISAASDPCLTLKLHPPLPPPSSTQNWTTATPSFSTSTPPKYSVYSSSKTHSHALSPERPGIIISLLSSDHFTG